MPESFVQLPADSTGKRMRTRQRVVSSQTIQEQYVIPTTERVVQNTLMLSTFRTLGNAATAHTLFTLENQSGSGVNLAVRRLGAYMDSTAALTSIVPSIAVSRTTAMPTGGTTLSKSVLQTGQTTSPAQVVARGATASDGGAATAITATASGRPLWQAMAQRLHTAVGQVLTDPMPILPDMVADAPFVLQPGEAMMVHIIALAAANNPNTNHYVVNCLVEEFTLP